MNLRNFSLFLIVLGAIILLLSAPSITGFAVFESGSLKAFNFLALAFILIGILLMSHAINLEKRVAVYDDGGNKTSKKREDDHFVMTDPHLTFGKNGTVYLGDFRKEIIHYRSLGKDGEEMIEVIRGEYGSSLHQLAASGDADKERVARAFLDILEPREEQEEKSYILNSEERREIQEAFRTWEGVIKKPQQEIMNKYSLTYSTGGKHGKFKQNTYGRSVTCSITPSDSGRVGLNVAADIIKMINSNIHDKTKKS